MCKRNLSTFGHNLQHSYPSNKCHPMNQAKSNPFWCAIHSLMWHLTAPQLMLCQLFWYAPHTVAAARTPMTCRQKSSFSKFWGNGSRNHRKRSFSLKFSGLHIQREIPSQSPDTARISTASHRQMLSYNYLPSEVNSFSSQILASGQAINILPSAVVTNESETEVKSPSASPGLSSNPETMNGIMVRDSPMEHASETNAATPIAPFIVSREGQTLEQKNDFQTRQPFLVSPLASNESLYRNDNPGSGHIREIAAENLCEESSSPESVNWRTH